MTADDPIATTTTGRVRGLWRERNGIHSAAFLGIPFAKPPVGALRFAAPVMPDPWDGVRDATEHGATAQRGDTGVTLIPEPSIPGDSTLNVDVFTPDPRATGLPVLVFIHGGGYTSGSPASPWYDGAAFTRDGIVTVTISYRLGFDGFGLIDGAPANRAVLDWIAALTWVRENIAAFGGDPGCVTIAGQSAGAAAVLTLLAVPAARGLFHRAMAFSAPISTIDLATARRHATALAEHANVPATVDGFASLSEERILDLQRTIGASADALETLRVLVGDGLTWAPVVDGDLLPHPLLDALAGADADGVPLLLGATDDEFATAMDGAPPELDALPAADALAGLSPQPPEVQAAYLRAAHPPLRSGTAALLGGYATDMVFRRTVPRVTSARGAAPTWAYRFAWASPTYRWALHCLDLPFWFDCLDAPGVTAIAGDAPPQELADRMHEAAVLFVRTGDPGWAAWSAQPGSTRVFDMPDGGVEPGGYDDVRMLA